MKFADYVLIITVAICFIAALVYTLRRRKSGGCMGCGTGGSGNGSRPNSGCGGCGGCNMVNGCSECSSYSAKKGSQLNAP
jgi:hypothetical protein